MNALKLIHGTVERYGKKQLVEDGTHEQGGRMSCINLIFTNKTAKIVGTGNHTVGIHHNH